MGKILPDLNGENGILTRLRVITEELMPGSKPHVYLSNEGNYVVNIHILTLDGSIVYGHCMVTPVQLSEARFPEAAMTVQVQLMRHRIAEKLREHREKLGKCIYIDHETYLRLRDVRKRSIGDGASTKHTD